MHSDLLTKFKFPDEKRIPARDSWSLVSIAFKDSYKYRGKELRDRIISGSLGRPDPERSIIAQKLHELLFDEVISGSSPRTITTEIGNVRRFIEWATRSGLRVSMDTIEDCFLQWAKSLMSDYRTGKQKYISATSSATSTARTLSRLLGLTHGLLKKSGITKRGHGQAFSRGKASKDDLRKSFSFGSLLYDICRSLSLEIVLGPPPIKITLQSGFSWFEPLSNSQNRPLKHKRKPHTQRAMDKNRDNRFGRFRVGLINLRIEAELLLFISQTGMNLSDAAELPNGRFSYSSHIDGYKVWRVYKRRRQGEVAFEIFSEYRTHFESYLKWRNELFPAGPDDILFPLFSDQRQNSFDLPIFSRVRNRCKIVGVEYFGPRRLRHTRINWLLRESHNPELTAEMAQHSQEVLFKYYDAPDHQTALIEISLYYKDFSSSYPSPSPTSCAGGTPEKADNSDLTPDPDCSNPSGCLFCVHHRDQDSFDYIWSLISYRHLKSLELAKLKQTRYGAKSHPAEEVINRITAKLASLKTVSQQHVEWQSEALERVCEGYFHPKWDIFIQLIEM